MASICNDERVRFGVLSGHERKTLKLSGRVARIIMSSTVLAFVSFSALAWCFGVRPTA
jgi:hypothetical protein